MSLVPPLGRQLPRSLTAAGRHIGEAAGVDAAHGTGRRKTVLRREDLEIGLLDAHPLLCKVTAAPQADQHVPGRQILAPLAGRGEQPRQEGAVEDEHLVAEAHAVQLIEEGDDVLEPRRGDDHGPLGGGQQLALHACPRDDAHGPLRAGQEPAEVGLRRALVLRLHDA